MADAKKGKRYTSGQRAKLAADLRAKYEGGASIRALAHATGETYAFVRRMLTEARVDLQGRPADAGPTPVEELARRKGIEPKTVNDLACPDAFESEEELNEFLEFVSEQRRENLV